MTGDQLAAAARALAGTPFRLHGRDPRTGLDCIGVLEAAFTAGGAPLRLPNGYALRARRLPPLGAWAAQLGLQGTADGCVPGDVLVLRPVPGQYHFAIATAPDRLVHAHAGLRRVVEGPLPAGWAVAGQWRLSVPPRNREELRHRSGFNPKDPLPWPPLSSTLSAPLSAGRSAVPSAR